LDEVSPSPATLKTPLIPLFQCPGQLQEPPAYQSFSWDSNSWSPRPLQVMQTRNQTAHMNIREEKREVERA